MERSASCAPRPEEHGGTLRHGAEAVGEVREVKGARVYEPARGDRHVW
jgi:hypothetical protein